MKRLYDDRRALMTARGMTMKCELVLQLLKIKEELLDEGYPEADIDGMMEGAWFDFQKTNEEGGG